MSPLSVGVTLRTPGRWDSPSQYSKAMAPFGRSGSPLVDTLSQEELSLPVQQSRSSLRKQQESLHQSSQIFSLIQHLTGASPSWCSRAVAPFGRSVGPLSII
ncbi:hypothetical protein ROHU_018942 [Labeo rohita]|uniref:Uncharacterized protein n=1 Tax=Labeo rohita TaxID=84645 RepID=A0A498NA18_LABRO|nr:hypothetical protein ROHU_018940 [Labeo rohita]RXN29213.1 hypothetical protein ROHU_018942 [Labeo rohita]